MKRETEILIARAAPLMFGVFAHNRGDGGSLTIRVGGSGIFIGPFLALTARHVTRDLWRMDTRADWTPRGPVEAQYSTGLLQLLDPFAQESAFAMWQVNRQWESMLTDVALLQASAHTHGGRAVTLQNGTQGGFFDWSLLPPPVGSQVTMLGFPGTDMVVRDADVAIGVNLTWEQGEVMAVHEIRRDRGMLRFPCFEVSKAVDHGFSGGPVFYNGQLCGVVSAVSFEDRACVATLWPLCLMTYGGLGIGELTSFGELFERRVLHASDWKHVRNVIAKREDENGTPYAHIDGAA